MFARVVLNYQSKKNDSSEDPDIANMFTKQVYEYSEVDVHCEQGWAEFLQ